MTTHGTVDTILTQYIQEASRNDAADGRSCDAVLLNAPPVLRSHAATYIAAASVELPAPRPSAVLKREPQVCPGWTTSAQSVLGMHVARQVDDLEGVRPAQRVLLPAQRVLAVNKRQRQYQRLLRAERHTNGRTARPRARRRWLGDALAFRRISARV